MEIRYTLTLDDYTEGNRMLLLHSTLARKVNYIIFVRLGWLIGIPTFCIAAALTVVNLLRPGSYMGAAWSGILAAIGWLGIMCMISPFTYRRRLTRCFKEQKLPSERILTTSDSGIHVARTDGESESRMSWSGFDKGLETEQMFVLFPNRRQFVSVPKRAMTPKQQDEFRDLMMTRVPGASPPVEALS